jgi:hypothetical protein
MKNELSDLGDCNDSRFVCKEDYVNTKAASRRAN